MSEPTGTKLFAPVSDEGVLEYVARECLWVREIMDSEGDPDVPGGTHLVKRVELHFVDGNIVDLAMSEYWGEGLALPTVMTGMKCGRDFRMTLLSVDRGSKRATYEIEVL